MFANVSYSTKLFFVVLIIALAFTLLACDPGGGGDGSVVEKYNPGDPYKNVCSGDCSNNPVDNLANRAADITNCLTTANNPLDCK